VSGFLGRRLLLAVAVLAAVSFGTFAFMATQFSATCTGAYTPTGAAAPPLASTVGQAARLYWGWVKGIPSGRSFSGICGGQSIQTQVWPAFVHTAALLSATAVLVAFFSLLFGTLAATRAGSALDASLRGFSYAAWAVPSFVLGLMLQSSVNWAQSRSGHRWFELSGWPGSCIGQGGYSYPCATTGGAFHHGVEVARHLVVPTLALSVAFIGLHSRYLRSSLLTSLHAPFTTTARAKGLPERQVVLRHALRNSLATFSSALLLDFGAIFGAAMAVDWVFRLNGLGTLFIAEVAGVGSGDSPRYLNPYAIESLLAAAALLVVGSSVLAEAVVLRLDPRTRP